MSREQQPMEQQQKKDGGLIELQGSLVNKLVKRVFKDKVVTAEFKRQFSKALSIFILYVQNAQSKKKYKKDDILAFLEQEGFGKIAEDLRKQRATDDNAAPSRKKNDMEKII